MVTVTAKKMAVEGMVFFELLLAVCHFQFVFSVSNKDLSSLSTEFEDSGSQGCEVRITG